MKNIAMVVCLHGDEPFGLEIAKKLSNKLPAFIGNPKAVQQKKRFIDSDMNRVFPGKKDGNYEEKQAFSLTINLKNLSML